MIIRLEEKRDYLEVENLVRNAFWNLYRPGAYEHYIVHNLRNDKSFIQKLAYVIEKEPNLVDVSMFVHSEEGIAFAQKYQNLLLYTFQNYNSNFSKLHKMSQLHSLMQSQQHQHFRLVYGGMT